MFYRWNGMVRQASSIFRSKLQFSGLARWVSTQSTGSRMYSTETPWCGDPPPATSLIVSWKTRVKLETYESSIHT